MRTTSSRARMIDALQRMRDLAIEASWHAQVQAGSLLRGALSGHKPQVARNRVRWPSSYADPQAAKWVETLRLGLSELAELELTTLPQVYEHVVPFEVEVDGEWHRAAIDYADRSDIQERCAREVKAYFKLQHRRGGYGRPNVVPGGYVPGGAHWARYLPFARELRDTQPPRYDVYGRFGLEFATGVRSGALARLNAQTRFRFWGGERVRYSRHLREIASSKVCVDLPGNGAFCFRLVDYLAVGACIVALPHDQELPGGLVDGENIVFARRDLSDLVDRCAELVEDDGRRERIARNARAFFDRYLHRSALAGGYLAELRGAASRAHGAPRSILEGEAR